MEESERFDYAVLLMDSGHRVKAEQVLKDLLREFPQNGYVWGTYGLVTQSLGRLGVMLDAFRKAVLHDPQTQIWREQLAYCLIPWDGWEEAWSAIKDCDSPGKELVQAGYLEFSGNLEDALSHLVRAEEMARSMEWVNDGRSFPPSVWLEKACFFRARLLRRQGRYEEGLEALGDCGDGPSILNERGFLYDKLGSPDKAWACFTEMNVRFGKIWDSEKWFQKRALESAYKPSATSTRDGSGFIFIVGIPRSGTSLTEQILSRHGQVRALGERNDLTPIVNTLGGQGWPELSPPQLDYFADMYIQSTVGGPPESGRFVTDKLPDNWRHVRLIQQLLPGAKIVHCIRNPEDVLASCYMQNFASEGLAWTFSLEGLKDYYDAWASADIPAYSLRYEDLVSSPAATVPPLLDYLGLPFEASCLTPHESSRQVNTASYAQVKEPIHQKAVGRGAKYKDYLAPIFGR